jgi:hypothetical protein
MLSAKYHNLEAQNIEYRRALFSTKEFSHRDGKGWKEKESNIGSHSSPPKDPLRDAK